MQEEIVAHYTREGLGGRLLDLLTRLGKNVDRLAPEDLAGIEDMHVGGRPATVRFAAALPLSPGMEVLDIGSGLGGPARHVALAHGCWVTGIDLTPALVETARDLSARVGMGDRVRFEVASALDLPFAEGTFDGAYTIHVGMNIADKQRFYGEACRVVKPGGFFSLYDVLRDRREPRFPVPWAADPANSHLVTLPELQAWVEKAGFVIRDIIDRTAEGREAMAESARRLADPEAAMRASAAQVMGADFAEKIRNLAAALEDGSIRVVELHALRP